VPFDRSAAERTRRLALGDVEVADEVHAAVLRVIGPDPAAAATTDSHK